MDVLFEVFFLKEIKRVGLQYNLSIVCICQSRSIGYGGSCCGWEVALCSLYDEIGLSMFYGFMDSFSHPSGLIAFRLWKNGNGCPSSVLDHPQIAVLCYSFWSMSTINMHSHVVVSGGFNFTYIPVSTSSTVFTTNDFCDLLPAQFQAPPSSAWCALGSSRLVFMPAQVGE